AMPTSNTACERVSWRWRVRRSDLYELMSESIREGDASRRIASVQTAPYGRSNFSASLSASSRPAMTSRSILARSHSVSGGTDAKRDNASGQTNLAASACAWLAASVSERHGSLDRATSHWPAFEVA